MYLGQETWGSLFKPAAAAKPAAPQAAKGPQWQQQHQKALEANTAQKVAQNQRAVQQQEQKAQAQVVALRAQAEQRAAAGIRRCISKARSATPENFETLKEELAQTLAKDFDGCGSIKRQVQDEADKCLEQAAFRVNHLTEQRAKQEVMQKELAAKRKEAEAKAETLLVELQGLLEEAEEAASSFADELESFAGSSPTSQKEAETAAKAAEESSKAAQEKMQCCHKFVAEQGATLRLGAPAAKPVVASKPNEGEEEAAKKDEKPVYGKLTQRLAAAKQGLDKATREFVTARDKTAKKAGAQDLQKASKAVFTKYDKDKDGMLSKKEIESFAKGEFKFTMPAVAIQLVLDSLVQGQGAGVKLADFQRLRVAVGVARERANDRQRRAAREEKEKVIAEQKKELQVTIDAAAAQAKAVEEETAKASKQSLSLFGEGKTLKSPAMMALGEELEALLTGARAKLAEAQELANGLGGVEEKALTVWMETEKRKLLARLKNFDNALTKAASTLEVFRKQAAAKGEAELKALGAKALMIMKNYQAKQSLDPNGLFKEVANKKKVDAAAFIAFMAKAQKAVAKADEAAEENLGEEDLGRVFKRWDDEEQGVLSQDVFVRLLRVLKKVLKEVAISDNLSIKDSKTLRKLEIGEVLEVISGPEADSDVQRFHARTTKDGLEGWVTVAGNKGSVFLADSAGVYKVIKETILTESFEIDPTKDDLTSRKLKMGELLEVREWEKKDEKTGLMRMKGKMRQDGLVGYLTTVGNTGIKFVEPL